MTRPPPRSTLTDTRFPLTSLFRSYGLFAPAPSGLVAGAAGGRHLRLDPRHGHLLHAGLLRILRLPRYGARPRGRLAGLPRHLPRRRSSAMARSEEHPSELQSLMRLSYDVFCLKKKTTTTNTP